MSLTAFSDLQILQELRRRGYSGISLSRVWQIQIAVADAFGVELKSIKSKGRGKRKQAEARQVAMMLAYEMTALSMVHIGTEFGWRHHATVAHALDAVQRRAEQSAHLRHKLTELRLKLSSL